MNLGTIEEERDPGDGRDVEVQEDVEAGETHCESDELDNADDADDDEENQPLLTYDLISLQDNRFKEQEDRITKLRESLDGFQELMEKKVRVLVDEAMTRKADVQPQAPNITPPPAPNSSISTYNSAATTSPRRTPRSPRLAFPFFRVFNREINSTSSAGQISSNSISVPALTLPSSDTSTPFPNSKNFRLDKDTYSLMMISKPFSRPWSIGVLTSLFFQFGLGIIISINLSLQYRSTCDVKLDDLGEAVMDDSGNPLRFCLPFNVPIRVPDEVTIAQFITILFVLATQSTFGSLAAINNLISLWYTSDTWKEVLKKADRNNIAGERAPINQDNGGIGGGPDGEMEMSFCLWVNRILIPSIAKFAQGGLIMFASFIIIVQSATVIDLLKDYSAVLFVSEGDYIMFYVAAMGFFGDTIAEKTTDVSETRIPVTGKKTESKVKMGSLLLLCVVMIVGWSYFAHGQKSGKFVLLKYPRCDANFIDPSEIANGKCNSNPPYNSPQCGFDGGDCILQPVEGYPKCFVMEPDSVSDNVCDNTLPYNTADCGFDGGDCKPVEKYNKCFVYKPELIGDGICHNDDQYNTPECGFDGKDCPQEVKGYPGCFVRFPERIGDGICHYFDQDEGDDQYSSPECGYDGGDCEPVEGYPNCMVFSPELINDGFCENFSPNNRVECGNDGGDCKPVEGYPGCLLPNPENIGDGICHNYLPYNTADCGFDGGDCKPVEGYPGCFVRFPGRIGDNICHEAYNTPDCDYDGKDCPRPVDEYPGCFVRFPERIGDNMCHDAYNTPECEYDGNDCPQVVDGFSDCKVRFPEKIGNGICHYFDENDDGPYKAPECGYDGGDCKPVDGYPDCFVGLPQTLADGTCHDSNNTPECGYDGYDCPRPVEGYPGCFVRFPETLGNGFCSDAPYNTPECGYDGGDCLPVDGYPNCFVDIPEKIGDGVCNNFLPYNTPDCGNDGGDCLPVDGYPNCFVKFPERIGDNICHENNNSEDCGFDGGDCLA